MFRLPPFVVAGALALLAPMTAHGWNNVGHMTIAKLAYEQLTTRQKLKVADILGKHPHYAIYLRTNRPAAISENEWAFLRASTWPDWVRPNRRRETRGLEVTKYNIGPDHYTKVYELVRQNVETLRGPNYRRDQLPELSTATTFASWVDEGAELAKSAVYLNGELRGARIREDDFATQVPELPVDYSDKSRALARRRLAIGSYRLLDKMTELFPNP